MIRYAWRDLVHNPRRTLAAMVGVALGVGLFSGVLFFVDGSAATMTSRALAPLALDMQRIVTADPAGLSLTERFAGPTALDPGQHTTIEVTVTNGGASAANDVVVRDEPPAPLAYVGDSTTVDGAAESDVDGDSPLSHGVAGLGFNVGAAGPRRLGHDLVLGRGDGRRRRCGRPRDAGDRFQPGAPGADRRERGADPAT